MASFSFKLAALSLASIFANSWMAIVADSDTIYDLSAPANPRADHLKRNQFASNGLTRPGDGGDYSEVIEIEAVQFPAGHVSPLHTDPQSSQLLLLVEGALEVGFVDTSNKLYTRRLQAGDMFMFPKGLVHFLSNPNNNAYARAISLYSGYTEVEFLPTTLLSSGIADGILAQSFRTDVGTIQKLKAGFGSYNS